MYWLYIPLLYTAATFHPAAVFFFSSGKNVRLAQGFWEFCYSSIAGIRKRMSTVHANSNLVLHTIRIGNLRNFPLASTYYYYYPCPC